MAYTPSGISLLSQGIGASGPRVWQYVSIDAIAAVDAADYFVGVGKGTDSVDAGSYGMETGDLVYVLNTTGSLTTICMMTVAADGDGTVTALTAVP